MRDLQKDWEMSQLASRGPWIEKGDAIYDGSRLVAGNVPKRRDRLFFINARQRWAENVKQAIMAEAKVKELETTLKIMEKQLEIAAREITKAHEEYDMCPSDYDGKLACVCEGTIADVFRCWRERWKQKVLAELEEGNIIDHSNM